MGAHTRQARLDTNKHQHLISYYIIRPTYNPSLFDTQYLYSVLAIGVPLNGVCGTKIFSTSHHTSSPSHHDWHLQRYLHKSRSIPTFTHYNGLGTHPKAPAAYSTFVILYIVLWTTSCTQKIFFLLRQPTHSRTPYFIFIFVYVTTTHPGRERAGMGGMGTIGKLVCIRLGCMYQH